MNDTVLILASPEDVHATAVAAILNSEFNVSTRVWDSARIPASDALSFHLAENGTELYVSSSQGDILPRSLRSIWWRRPGRFKLDEAITDLRVRDFCLRECDYFFKGAMEASGVPIINNPTAQSAAARKPFQLAVARRVGLTAPKTLMSNDPVEVRAFWENLHGNCVYKVFTSPYQRLVETRILGEEDLKDLEKLRYAPVIVQERVEKGLDVRVSIFGESLFAASVRARTPAADVDSRLDPMAPWQQHELPNELSRQLITLLRMLRLDYGCIDLRLRPDGTYVFFEVNPSGQFLFIEMETGLPLTRAMAELLHEAPRGTQLTSSD